MVCTFLASDLRKVAHTCQFLAFWLGNVLRATTMCNFSFLIWPDGSAPAALASLILDPPTHKSLENILFCDFPNISRTYSSLFYSSLLSDSSHLWCSSVHIVGSWCSKLSLIIELQIFYLRCLLTIRSNFKFPFQQPVFDRLRHIIKDGFVEHDHGTSTMHGVISESISPSGVGDMYLGFWQQHAVAVCTDSRETMKQERKRLGENLGQTLFVKRFDSEVNSSFFFNTQFHWKGIRHQILWLEFIWGSRWACLWAMWISAAIGHHSHRIWISVLPYYGAFKFSRGFSRETVDERSPY